MSSKSLTAVRKPTLVRPVVMVGSWYRVALVLTALVQVHILSYFPAWNGWMTPLVVGVSIVASLALIALRLGRRATRPLAMAAVAAGGLSLLMARAIWSEYTVKLVRGTATRGSTPAALPV